MRLILWGWEERARAQLPRPLPPGQPAWRDIGHADAPQQGVLHALFGRKFHQRFGRIAPRGRGCVFGRHCERIRATRWLAMMVWTASLKRHLVPKRGRRSATEGNRP